MKKILGLTVAAVLVMGLVGGGTWAFFSDTESASFGTLSAGTLDLELDGANSAVSLFSVTDIYPGRSGSAYTTLSNAGNLEGEMDILLSAITNTESSAGNEFTGDSGNGSNGELGAYLEIAMFIDIGEDGSYNDGTDIGLKSDGTLYTSGSLDYDIVDNYASETFNDVYSGNMTVSQSDRFYVAYDLPTAVSDPWCMGDAVDFTITFELEQPEVD
jgi:predicted ribosomally synthesized peptide with SipW-like signal peptide